jgi:hypothetical protein
MSAKRNLIALILGAPGGGKGTISEFTFSSINMVPGVISTAATTLHSSFIINIGANKYKIPLEKI